MTTLITGSLAFDTIMVFPDRFANHILPTQTHILNVSFTVPQMRREFGGCAGNIAYNLKLLGGDPLPMATVGRDFAPYREWLQSHGMNLAHIREIPDAFTAQAFVTTDADNNQITAFHPGAMAQAHLNSVADAGPGKITLGIVAPDGRDAMLQHAAQFADAGIPFIFDPGQAMPAFNGDELRQFIAQASWVAVNDYESEMLREKTGLRAAEIAEQVRAFIVTRGAGGVDMHADGECLHIDAVRVAEARDPTGCGDAFRAGLLYGIARGLDWRTCGRIASLVAGIKVEKHGTQNHSFTADEFAARYRESFGEEVRLVDATP